LSYLAHSLGRRRVLATYSVGLAAAALVYFLTAFSGAGWKSVLVEFVGLGLFGSLALVGVRRSSVLLALVGCCTSLGILSAQASIAGSRMPYWYRWACAGFDLVIAGYILGRFGGRGA